MGRRLSDKKYPGVYTREKDGEKCFYIRYRRGGRGSKEIEEPIGKVSEGMTAAKASRIRALRIAGKELSNTERRAEGNRFKEVPTVRKLWEKYDSDNLERKTRINDVQTLFPKLGRLADKDASQLTMTDIASLKRELATIKSKRNGEPISPQTQRHVLALLRRILRYADKLGIMPFPAGLRFELPKVDNQKTELMTESQYSAYLRALDDEPDSLAAAFLRFVLFTGIRKMAAMSLKWSDIDMENGIACLRGETAKSGRTNYIPLNSEAMAAIQGLPKTSEWVFPSEVNPGAHRTSFKRAALRARNKAGLPADFRPLHGLRHSFASRLANSGKVTLPEIQALLTHENISMTSRYSHLLDSTLRRAAEAAAIRPDSTGGEE